MAGRGLRGGKSRWRLLGPLPPRPFELRGAAAAATTAAVREGRRVAGSWASGEEVRVVSRSGEVADSEGVGAAKIITDGGVERGTGGQGQGEVLRGGAPLRQESKLVNRLGERVGRPAAAVIGLAGLLGRAASRSRVCVVEVAATSGGAGDARRWRGREKAWCRRSWGSSRATARGACGDRLLRERHGGS